MRSALLVVFAALVAGVAYTPQTGRLEPVYIPTSSCIQGCHTGRVDDFTPWTDFPKSGHGFILNKISGAAPTYPAGTSPGVTLPAGTSWSDFAYVVGGYARKALYVRTDGRIYTADDQAQLNLADGSRVAFHQGEVLPYDQACFRCHTTGSSPDDGTYSNSPGAGLGSFFEAGVKCQACHGPGSEHQAGAFGGVLPPNRGVTLQLTVCQGCHSRHGGSGTPAAENGFILNEQQADEFSLSRHAEIGFTCATCHNPHVPLHYEGVASAGASGIRQECQSCHVDKQVLLNDAPKPVECVDCHMASATKSALGGAVGNGFMGDVPTHLFAINGGPVGREAMFTPDGSEVSTDGGAAVTLDFVCLGCHTNRTVEWAADFASAIHSAGGLHTAAEDAEDLPTSFALEQNYPNPFNPSTAVGFSLPRTTAVTLRVYDAAGRLMGTVLDQTMPAGYHSVTLDAAGLATGVYLYELRAGDFTATRSMVVSK